MPDARDVHRTTTRLMSAVRVVIGVAMIALTVARGGGVFAVGVIAGAAFIVLGAVRYRQATRPGP